MQPKKCGEAREISVQEKKVEVGSFNLFSSSQNRCLFLANFCEALIF